ncbi:MAG TPA: saccharopine dehydrogenase C-terminal domain-containing protein [Usitatibacteraceae bacterium]|nr:saccharopine dehydrogenase C-terminal domain-containing protein [Usitatibacteraceae bacterium]
MAAALNKVVVLGLGKVGSLVGTLLTRSGFSITGYDMAAQQGLPFRAEQRNVSDRNVVAEALKGHDAVVSCLPFHLNVDVARIAHGNGMHYFDLTEDVPTTKAIREMAVSAEGVMAPQCGLAPGFIGIVGADLARRFDALRSIELRVGALPQHPRGKLGYALNWSPEGVINEYINDCEVIRNGRAQMVPALEGLETILVHGLMLESFTTSGGLGTMCETYLGKVQELNYKTMRYPGHCELMRFLLNEMYLRNDRELANKLLKNALPAVDEDVVFVHAAVEGQRDGRLSREEFVRAYPAMTLDGKAWRSISWTTAASLCAVVEMVRDGSLPAKGFLKQEEVPFDKFMATENGGLYRRAESVAAGAIFTA